MRFLLQSISTAAARTFRTFPACISAVASVAAIAAATATPLLAQQCAPAGGGTPCETASGVASLGDPDGSDLTVGNPIHPVTGNKYQEEEDAPPLPGSLGLEIRRHFNSAYVSADGPWGRGWSLSYDTRLHRSDSTLQIVQADGRRLLFSAPAQAGAGHEKAGAGNEDPACVPAAPGQGRLFVEPDGYRWLWPQRRELLFDRHGNLVQIRPGGGSAREAVRIARDAAGRITHVTDPAGRRMAFHYDPNGYLSRISHPLGQWKYRIDGTGQMESVSAPDGVVRRYRYDDIGHRSRFTAIAIAAGSQAEQVVGQWSYDAQGRAVRFRRADGSEIRMTYGQERQDGDDDPGGQGESVSILTNALGARTTYKAVEIAGKWRVTEIRGPGCEECGPVDIRMRYDRQAQLLARWKIGGDGVEYRRDRQGRVVRILSLRQPDKGTRENLETLQRLEYSDEHTAWPDLVARPSVVQGMEHRLLMIRDEQGNLVEITQAGYAPGIGSGGAAPAVPIRRTVRMRYEEVSGRRVLVAVDGPLPNGPAGNPSDSDVTRFGYDGGGNFVQSVVSPGGIMRTIVSRDPGGRPVVTLTSDGHREVEEQLAYNLRGQMVLRQVTAWLLDPAGRRLPGTAVLQRFGRRYDPQGRLVQVVDPAGRVTRFDRDRAGRPSGVRDARGYRSVLTRDAEGHLRVAGLHEPGSEHPLRAAYYLRNQAGRLQSLLLPDGRQFRFHYHPGGYAIGFTDVARRLHLALPAGPPVYGASDVVDDFGQVLERNLPDHGTRTMRFDEAGRVVAVADATGAGTDYRYDAADRLLSTGPSESAATVTYAYEGRFLVSVDDPAQQVRHRRDALGRIVQTSTRLVGLDGGPLQVSTSYDADTGAVTGQGLADGQSIQLDGGDAESAGVARQLTLRSAAWTSVGRLLNRWLPGSVARRAARAIPAATVVRDIEVHPFNGLAGFTHGNGIRMSRRFDLAGRTSRLRSASAAGSLANWRYGYGSGPRIVSIEAMVEGQPGAQPVSGKVLFAYDAAGALKTAVIGPGSATKALATDASASGAGIGAGVELDKAGRVARDERFRYSYSAHGQLQTVRDVRDERRVADYAYNHRGQRISKTVYDDAGQAAATVFYLWSDRRLIAEIDPDGTITAQYLSLDDGHRELPVAKLQRSGSGRRESGKRHGEYALMALHADHRGAPVAMTDASQRPVWRAAVAPSGLADVLPLPGGPELNLRLPGQYRDAETGLHDNWHRTYDPRNGRYLQPDPLGYPDGPDPYAYAGGDPVNRVDPLGLYQIDIHYYMTFFLGVTAGLDPEEARIVALAAQYVDDNPLTRPLDGTDLGTTVGSILRNQRQLLGYHFVLSGTDGRTLPAYRNSNLTNPDSPQLLNLLNAARSNAVGRNGSLQFLGEYLHALADTYSHRNADNLPYDALVANCGVGHGHAIHEPDLTYDDLPASPSPADEGLPSVGQAWRREARTLGMELSLHGVLLAYGDPAKAKTPQEIESALRAFNAIRESDESGSPADFAGKIEHLQSTLEAIGFGTLDLTNEDSYAYNERDARTNRLTFLRDILTNAPLVEVDFPGTCLEGGTRCTQE